MCSSDSIQLPKKLGASKLIFKRLTGWSEAEGGCRGDGRAAAASQADISHSRKISLTRKAKDVLFVKALWPGPALVSGSSATSADTVLALLQPSVRYLTESKNMGRRRTSQLGESQHRILQMGGDDEAQ